MKYLLPIALLTPTAALAHAGDHFGLSVQGILHHVMSQPDHTAMVVAGCAVAGLLVWRARARE
jgi:hypothetical protein